MTIEFATQADIPAIMAIERTPGFEGFIGRWSEEQHAGEMAKASTRYFVHRDSGEVKASRSSSRSATPTAAST